MISSTLVALSAFVLSASAGQIQSRNPSFFSAGIQGCITAAENTDGEPVVIHNCNTEDTSVSDWTATFAIRGDTSPSPIQIYGNKCIDVTNGVNADGTLLQIWTCSGGPNQQWVNRLDGSFQWSGTNKCIDLTNGALTDGTQLQLWTCSTGDSNQVWSNAPDPDFGGPQIILGGNVTDQPPATFGQPLCVGAVDNADGAAVVLSGCGIGNASPLFPNANFTWVMPFAPLTGTLQIYDNKCMDVTNGENQDGVFLQIWTCVEGSTNQQFRIGSSEGRSTIEWAGSGKCVDLTNGNSTMGTPIQLWDCDGVNTNQLWQIDTVQV
ncbi:ricin B lectin domain-containing protein [Mycena sanguinolenta]|nr:ricin B lectin domain-containing protein [Mycena sanguinolenta]